MRSLLTRSKADLVGACIVLAIGALLVIHSPSYGLYAGAVIGPGFMPFWFGVALLVFGASTVVGALMQARRSIAEERVQPQHAKSPALVGAPATDEPAAEEPEGTDDPGSDDDQVATTPQSEDASTAAPRQRARKVTVVFASTLLAAALTPVLGALVAFGLLIFGLLLVVERERWWLSAVVSMGVMYVLYLLFLGFLRIPLPTGPWEF